MIFPHPVLLCDVGGTNARFALSGAPGQRPVPLASGRTADAPGLAEAARAAVRNAPELPRSMLVCAAGPLAGRSLALTNAAWRIDGPAVARQMGLAQGLLFNDFEAMAYALPSLGAADVRPIGHIPWTGEGLQVVLGPGTGLGVAALAHIDGRFAALPTEAGHVDMGPVGAVEEALWPHLERVHGRVTAEAVLSGPGLARLYAALRAALGHAPEARTAAEITLAGLAGPGDERDALALLWRIAARFAGDMAIAYLARGGVTLAGGVLPRIQALLDDAAFRGAFEAKQPMDALVRTIPTRLVTSDTAVLTGMAAIAAAPERFAIDYANRLWV
ncbi:MAG: glucokinase [Beijerinckiaceae bacterium]|nr:glucokinase [Beijerinckiaceae bacterium]